MSHRHGLRSACRALTALCSGSLRPENDPYLGFVDCARRIAQEEGLRAFYRGWWVTAAMGLVTGGGIAFLFWAGAILTNN